MRTVNGITVLTFRGTPAIRRRGRYLPSSGERFHWVATRDWWLFVWWRKGIGWRLITQCEAVPPHRVIGVPWDNVERSMAIRKREALGEAQKIPALDPAGKYLVKCPMLLEFVSATAYEDGSVRQPGYFTLRNRLIEWEVTVYDPDAGARMAVRARSLDQVFVGLETLLGSPDAPWEPDQYLLGRLPKKKKK